MTIHLLKKKYENDLLNMKVDLKMLINRIIKIGDHFSI